MFIIKLTASFKSDLMDHLARMQTFYSTIKLTSIKTAKLKHSMQRTGLYRNLEDTRLLSTVPTKKIKIKRDLKDWKKKSDVRQTRSNKIVNKFDQP